MDDVSLNLAIIMALVGVNAAFAGTEIAVVSMRKSQVMRLAEDRGKRGRQLLALSEDPTRFLSTLQVGITLAGFLASATAAVSLSEPLVPLLGFLGGAAPGVALMIVTMVLAFISLVFGELVPKRVAMRHPVSWALRMAGPVTFIAKVAKPVVWLLSRTIDVFARMLGVRGSHETLMTDEEVMDVIATEADITPARRALVEGVLELEERTVREILTPRRDVLTISADMSVPDAVLALARGGHSRAPVVEGEDLDNTIGIVVLAKLAAQDPAGEAQACLVRDCVDEPLLVPEGARVPDVLRLMQTQRRHLALVADEYGSIVGIVTMEDLLEEIVGELYDELDRDLSSSDPRGYKDNGDGWYELPGSFPLHDLPDLGLPEVNHPQVATIGGLLMETLERMPLADDCVVCDEIEIRVDEMDGTVIERVHVRRTSQ